MAHASTERKVWIDTDAGLDDAQAILMALAQPDLNIVGISATHGNTGSQQVCKNLLRLLKIADRLEVPIYKGCSGPMLGKSLDYTEAHGTDGFGDVPDPSPPDLDLIRPEHAINALMRTVRERPGEITLVCLGPLTNIAIAIRMDPEFGSHLKDCYIMGGNYEGKGNITATGEFNFLTDPEAAQIVLNDLGCPITLSCWELVLKHTLPWETYWKYVGADTEKAKLIKQLNEKVLATYYSPPDCPQEYETPDETIMAALINAKVVKKSTRVRCTVEVAGPLTRGMMVVDWENRQLPEKNTLTLLLELDHEQFEKLLFESLRA